MQRNKTQTFTEDGEENQAALVVDGVLTHTPANRPALDTEERKDYSEPLHTAKTTDQP